MDLIIHDKGGWIRTIPNVVKVKYKHGKLKYKRVNHYEGEAAVIFGSDTEVVGDVEYIDKKRGFEVRE